MSIEVCPAVSMQAHSARRPRRSPTAYGICAIILFALLSPLARCVGLALMSPCISDLRSSAVLVRSHNICEAFYLVSMRCLATLQAVAYRSEPIERMSHVRRERKIPRPHLSSPCGRGMRICAGLCAYIRIQESRSRCGSVRRCCARQRRRRD
ncbi:hypothetical protein EXIGLDRAFT_99261 [Exidia glandulosa HHB12029]|uniref:Uncharacterized protein n=1 Tax=Exidia glandulosa HHB12029 TaxID=1314781 RepID=A0A165NQ74_EXIGL|nr:hypothetical protein EXIGLDRAFT_99261 [Exidia glandulosa HHB12029]